MANRGRGRIGWKSGKRIWSAAGLAGTSLILTASPVTSSPAAVVLNAKEAAAAFGARERVLDISISPDGKQVAIISPGPKQSTVVQVLDTATGDGKAVNFANGDPFFLNSCAWATTARLVCQLYGVSDREGPMSGYTRMLAMDASGANVLPLGRNDYNQYFITGSDGSVIDYLDGKSPTVLVQRFYQQTKGTETRAGSMLHGLAVERVDVMTGTSQRIEGPEGAARRYLSDGRGHVRMIADDGTNDVGYMERGVRNYRYRLKDDTAWRPFSSVRTQGNESGLRPIRVDPTLNAAYALDRLDGRDALYRVSLDGTLKRELVLSNPKVDIDGTIQIGRAGRVIGGTYATDRRERVYFEPAYQQLAASLQKALPGLPLIQFVESTADEQKLLIFAGSDVNPGRYYLFDRTNKRLEELSDVRPALSGVALAPVKSISYRAADGTDVPAYLTLPPGSTGKGVPAIVMPHGGPGARDEWGFDWLAQFFANRGFAVLQPNFRGSTGYGDQWFNRNGFRSWRTAIGDVNDGARWLVSSGVADPARLAIVGWSYGGYAALQANALDPSLFKAAIAIAPVTDLTALRDSYRRYTVYDVVRAEFGTGPELIEGSPARQVGKFKVPVLMFHGDHDINVDIAQSRLMDGALRKAGKTSQLIVYPGLDHQLGDSAARTDMLDRSDTFLRAALKMQP